MDKLDVKLWENCSLLKSTSLVFELMRIMNILEIILGIYLLRNVFPFSKRDFLQYYKEFCLIFAGVFGWLGWGSWYSSTVCGILYLFLGFTLKTSFFSCLTVNGINLMFLILGVLYFIHVYFLKPKS